MTKVLVSGGHLTPALALIDYGLTQGDMQFVFVGRDYSQAQTQQKSHEEAEVKQRGIQFISFDSGKLSAFSLLHTLQQGKHFVVSLGHAWQIFQEEKPDVFVSFGGYLAVPLMLVAYLRRIPIVTHEQTRTAG